MHGNVVFKNITRELVIATPENVVVISGMFFLPEIRAVAMSENPTSTLSGRRWPLKRRSGAE